MQQGISHYCFGLTLALCSLSPELQGQATAIASTQAGLAAQHITSSTANSVACQTIITTQDAKRCIGSARPAAPIPELEPTHIYTLPELIDIAETSSPQGRIAWAAAKRSMARAGVEQALYLPLITLAIQGSDVRAIVPFPKPLAPRGYVTVEQPIAASQLELEYTLLDFARGSKVDASKALQLASTLNLSRIHQGIAYRTSSQFFKAQEARGHLAAAQTILKTAETLLENSQSQFDNGRATLPDLQNAQAGVAEARFDFATASGEVKKANLALTETIGVEPSANIELQAQQTDMPGSIDASVDTLIHAAWNSRPDLLARVQQLRSSKNSCKTARAAYLPTVGLSATGGQTATWPTADFGQLGYANVSTWSVAAKLRWEVFNGARRHEVEAAQAEQLSTSEELRETKDAVTRQVWETYVDYQTALDQVKASQSFLTAAQTSYDSSLDAYKFGVRSLVDVVQAERQLAQARLTDVRSRAQLMQSAVALSYATGNLPQSALATQGVQP
jgi:outer membrane protein